MITRVLVENTYKIAFDGASFANECEAGVVNENRIWWVQAEAIVGFINAFQKTGDSKYMDAARALWKFTKTYIVDTREGSEWFWEVHPDGTPIMKPIVEPWKCPYHNGRMCLEMITRLSANVD